MFAKLLCEKVLHASMVVSKTIKWVYPWSGLMIVVFKSLTGIPRILRAVNRTCAHVSHLLEYIKIYYNGILIAVSCELGLKKSILFLYSHRTFEKEEGTWSGERKEV